MTGSGYRCPPQSGTCTPCNRPKVAPSCTVLDERSLPGVRGLAWAYVSTQARSAPRCNLRTVWPSALTSGGLTHWPSALATRPERWASLMREW
jgi:hypothetical protein